MEETSMLQEKSPALQREHLAIKNMIFFQGGGGVIFAFLVTDPDPESRISNHKMCPKHGNSHSPKWEVQWTKKLTKLERSLASKDDELALLVPVGQNLQTIRHDGQELDIVPLEQGHHLL